MNRNGVAVLLGCLGLASACGGSGGDEAGAVAEWTLSAEPTLVIGEDGTAAGEFERVSDVLALPGGEIAVVDAGPQEIRVFDASGVWQRTLSRAGSGPGEFTSINWVQLSNDTLVVYDGGQRRLTLLGADGVVHSTLLWAPQSDALLVFPRARAADGQWVVLAHFRTSAAASPGMPPAGLVRDTIGIGLLDGSAAGSIDLLLRILDQPLIAVPAAGMMGPARFSAPLSVVRVGGRVAVLDPQLGSLWWVEAGEPMVALGIPRRPLAGSVVDSLREDAVESSSDPRRRMMMEAMLASDIAPAEMPMFSLVLPDGQDQLWLEEWQFDRTLDPRYLVVDADGAWQAAVQMPPGFRPRTIGPDWVLGIHRDADGLNRVMKFGLVRR